MESRVVLPSLLRYGGEFAKANESSTVTGEIKTSGPSAMSRQAPLRLYLLGSFCIERSGQVIRLPRRKVEALLAYLALYPQSHRREELAALLWGDSSDAEARTSLRTALGVLRKHLGTDLLVADRESVQLNPDFLLWVDAHELERAGRRPETSGGALTELYRGELLTGLYDDWVLPLREHYRQVYLDALLLQSQELRSQGEYDRAIEVARSVLSVDRANERAYQHLIFCFVALGNRSIALEAFEQCRQALAEELAVEPSRETLGLYEWIRQTPSEAPSLAARLTNLPIPLTSFVGRTRELAELKRLMTDGLGHRPPSASLSGPGKSVVRLVTFTGPGGSGKTRLAIQVGTELIDHVSDGVWWVDLSRFADGALVPAAVAKTLGLEEVAGQPLSASIAAFVHTKHLLLILDNCEHLISACAGLVEELLSACPKLQVLTTSREPLGLTGEAVWQVPALSTPAHQWLSTAQLWLSYESIRLFVERARGVKTEFALTDRNAAAIAQICRRLDGIPLALELAAVRANVLTPQEIALRLDDRFSLLTQGSRTALPRQQTLRALIDWSYDLLSGEERTLFRRLAVFSGGRNLRAVEAVCTAEDLQRTQMLDLLSRLVFKSLLTSEERDGETRYGFLDTVKEYAREKLAQSGETERVRDRHLDYFLELTTEAEPRLYGPEQLVWLNRLETEQSNFRQALMWALSPVQGQTPRNPAAGLRLAGGLYWYWVIRGPLSEGRRWLEHALALNPETPTAARARALAGLGEIAFNQNDQRTAYEAFERSLAIWRELDDRWWIAFCVLSLAWVLYDEGKAAEARPLFEQAYRLARALGEKSLIARALRGLGNVLQSSDVGAAAPLLEESAALFREVGDVLRLGHTLNALGTSAFVEQDYPRAVALYTESQTLLRQTGDRVSVISPIMGLGRAMLALGEVAKAEAFFAEGLELADKIGDPVITAANIMGLGGVALARGELERGVQWLAAGNAALTSGGFTLAALRPHYRLGFEQDVAAARGRMEAATFDAAWQKGAELTLEQAIAWALGKHAT